MSKRETQRKRGNLSKAGWQGKICWKIMIKMTMARENNEVSNDAESHDGNFFGNDENDIIHDDNEDYKS